LIEGRMNYLIELFSAKSDQVKLVTFAFSAILALTVLLINQTIINQRTKREFLLGKVEELSNLSIEFTRVSGEMLDELVNRFEDESCENYDLPYAVDREIYAVLRKIELICELYFEKTNFSVGDYHLSHLKSLEYIHKWRAIDLTEGGMYNLFDEDYQLIKRREEWLAEICLDLAKRHAH
ncbi:TPA: hypothetical protein ACGU2T_004496, partial [Vibrio vulnificus]